MNQQLIDLEAYSNHLLICFTDRGEFEQAAHYQRESLDACAAVRVKESLVDVVAGIAISAIRTGRTAAGVRLYAATVALATSINYRIETPEQERYELAIVTARSTLGPEAFDAARSAGLSLSVDEMVADARGIIDGIAEGDCPAQAPTSAGAPAPSQAFGPTQRELEVLALLAGRLTDPEIAAHLYLSPRTIEGHVAKILGKLVASNRREAAALAVRYQLV